MAIIVTVFIIFGNKMGKENAYTGSRKLLKELKLYIICLISYL